MVLFSLQKLKADLIHHFDSQLNELVESLIDESHRLGSSSLSGSSEPRPDTERDELRCELHCEVFRRNLGDGFFYY